MSEQCKAMMSVGHPGEHQCGCPAKEDGYCYTHHPERLSRRRRTQKLASHHRVRAVAYREQKIPTHAARRLKAWFDAGGADAFARLTPAPPPWWPS